MGDEGASERSASQIRSSPLALFSSGSQAISFFPNVVHTIRFAVDIAQILDA